MCKVLSERIKTTGMEELLSGVTMNAPEEIDLELIRPFKDHPFKVLDDDKMEALVESVLQQGIITPVIVRPVAGGGDEMISGHRRMHAAMIAKMKKLPAIVMDLTDDEATIVIRDLDLLTIGMVNEMFIENQNDDVADKVYHRTAGQAEFDAF